MRIFNPGRNNSSSITYNDTAANIVDGTTAANLQSAIVALDARVDAVEASVKTVLNTPTNFYIDAVNGADGSNNGQTVITAFKSLLYALVYIRDHYIIDSSITVNLLTDLPNAQGLPIGELSLVGFDFGVSTVYPTLTFKGGDNSVANKKIFSSFSTIYFQKSPIYFTFENIDFVSINAVTQTINFINSDLIYFNKCNFTRVSLYFTDCKEPYIQGISSSINSVFEDCNLIFDRCHSPYFSDIELKNNSSISLNTCSSMIFNQLRSIRVSGVKTSDTSYVSLVNCQNIGWLNSYRIVSSAIRGKLLEIRDCLSIDIRFTFVNNSGGTVTFTPDANDTDGYPVAVYRSEEVVLRQGSNTKFITSPSNKGLLVDNQSEVDIGTGTTAATNLPITGVINSIGSEAFINGANFRSTTGLVATAQGVAIDTLSTEVTNIKARYTQRLTGLLPSFTAGQNTWSLAAGTGRIVDNYTNPDVPVIRAFTRTTVTGIARPALLNGTTVTSVYVYLFWTGTIVDIGYQQAAPVSDDLVDKLFICAILATSPTVLLEVRPISLPDEPSTKSLLDHGAVNVDNVYPLPIANTMRLSFPGGRFKFAGRNAYTNPKLPHTLTFASVAQLTYTFCDPNGNILSTGQTDFNFNRVWNGTAVVALTSTANFVAQFIYLYPNGAFTVVVGTNEYTSQNLIISQWQTRERLRQPASFKNNARYLGALLGIGSANNINDTTQVIIHNANN